MDVLTASYVDGANEVDAKDTPAWIVRNKIFLTAAASFITGASFLYFILKGSGKSIVSRKNRETFEQSNEFSKDVPTRLNTIEAKQEKLNFISTQLKYLLEKILNQDVLEINGNEYENAINKLQDSGNETEKKKLEVLWKEYSAGKEVLNNLLNAHKRLCELESEEGR